MPVTFPNNEKARGRETSSLFRTFAQTPARRLLSAPDESSFERLVEGLATGSYRWE